MDGYYGVQTGAAFMQGMMNSYMRATAMQADVIRYESEQKRRAEYDMMQMDYHQNAMLNSNLNLLDSRAKAAAQLAEYERIKRVYEEGGQNADQYGSAIESLNKNISYLDSAIKSRNISPSQPDTNGTALKNHVFDKSKDYGYTLKNPVFDKSKDYGYTLENHVVKKTPQYSGYTRSKTNPSSETPSGGISYSAPDKGTNRVWEPMGGGKARFLADGSIRKIDINKPYSDWQVEKTELPKTTVKDLSAVKTTTESVFNRSINDLKKLNKNTDPEQLRPMVEDVVQTAISEMGDLTEFGATNDESTVRVTGAVKERLSELFDKSDLHPAIKFAATKVIDEQIDQMGRAARDEFLINPENRESIDRQIDRVLAEATPGKSIKIAPSIAEKIVSAVTFRDSKINQSKLLEYINTSSAILAKKIEDNPGLIQELGAGFSKTNGDPVTDPAEIVSALKIRITDTVASMLAKKKYKAAERTNSGFLAEKGSIPFKAAAKSAYDIATRERPSFNPPQTFPEPFPSPPGVDSGPDTEDGFDPLGTKDVWGFPKKKKPATRSKD